MTSKEEDPFLLRHFAAHASDDAKKRWNSQCNPAAAWALFQCQLGNFGQKPLVQPDRKPVLKPEPYSIDSDTEDDVGPFCSGMF